MAKKIKINSGLAVAIAFVLILLFKTYIAPTTSSEQNSNLDDSSSKKVSENENIVKKDDEKSKFPLENTDNPTISEKLKIHYIDVGQADSILVTLNNSAMLIDAGNNDDGTLVVDYLRKQNIKSLDYLVGTHPHEDHIGGLDDIINNFEIKKILMPKASTTTKTFEDVLDAISNKGLKVTAPQIGDIFKLDEAEFTILSSVNNTPKDLNDASIVLRLVYKEESYLFTGDASSEVEYEMLRSGQTLQSDVIKIGHHGSSTSTSEMFINAVNPKVAIISVGKDNDYGHPHDKTINKLERLGITTYRTDLNGTIVITSDGGKTIKVVAERSGN